MPENWEEVLRNSAAEADHIKEHSPCDWISVMAET